MDSHELDSTQSLNNMPTEFRFTSRHLSASEILTDLLQNQGADVLLHVAILQSRMRITEGLLHRALHILARFQPALRMRIATESGQRHAINRRFVEMEHVGVECDVIRGTDRKSWLAAAEVELQQPFEADTGPLWKVRYIEFTNMDDTASIASTSSRRSSSGSTGGGRHEGALFLKIHPAIADGVSIFDLLHGQLISILNTVSRDGDLTRFQTALSMLPSADESFSEKNKFIWSKKDSVRLLSDEEPVVERFRPAFTCLKKVEVPVGHSSTHVLPFALSPAASMATIEACKRQGVSVHACLMTACAHAIATVSSWQSISVPDELVFGYPIDLRQYRTFQDPAPLGLWLGYGKTRVKGLRHPLTPDKFWEEAKKAQSATKSETQKPWKAHASHVDILKKVIKFGDVSPMVDYHSGVHLQLDNLGNCDKRIEMKIQPQQPPMENGHRTDHIQMSEYYMMRSMGDVSNVPMTLSVCTYKGRLMCTLTYNGRWVTRTFATRFIDCLIKALKEVVSTLGLIQHYDHLLRATDANSDV